MKEHDFGIEDDYEPIGFTIEEDNPLTEDDQGLGYSGNGFTGV